MMTLGWGRMWFRGSDSACSGPVPAAGMMLYSVLPLPLLVRPTVVLDGALNQELPEVGMEEHHETDNALLKVPQSKVVRQGLPQACLHLSQEDMFYAVKELRVGTGHSMVMRLQGRTLLAASGSYKEHI